MRGYKGHWATPASRLPLGAGASRTAAEREAALKELETLDTPTLQMRWREAFGRNAPPRLGVDLLRRAIAYRLQELELGGLSRQVHLRLKSASNRARKGDAGQGTGSVPVHIKAGTRFVREWQGEVHEVQVIDTGDFVYRGKTYHSLSTLACEITGTHQSGPRFFGISRGGAQRARKGIVNG